MQKVRAKFTAQVGEGSTVVLVPDYSASPEDQQFAKATPSGRIEMVVDNPGAREFFRAGKTYYVDFTEAAPPESIRGEAQVRDDIEKVKGR